MLSTALIFRAELRLIQALHSVILEEVHGSMSQDLALSYATGMTAASH